MTVWDLIKQLSECEPDSVVHFSLDVDQETLYNLGKSKEDLKEGILLVDEIVHDGPEMYIKLYY